MSTGRNKINDGYKTPQDRYNAAYCLHMSLKLNYKTDDDIITAIEGKRKQTEIKRLVRLGLEAEKHK